MISLYVSTVFVLILSLTVWVFINSTYFFELYFNWKLKAGLNSDKENIFDTIVDGKVIPKYIRDVIGKSADKYELLSYYLMSEELINRQVYKDRLNGNLNPDCFEKCFIWTRLIFGLIFLIFLICFIFSDNFLYSGLKKIIIIYCSFFVILVKSMPYNIFFKNNFLNKFQSVLAYWQIVVFSIFNSLVVYFYFKSDIEIYAKWVLDKNFIVYGFSIFMIFFGAYTYTSYIKFDYMNKFFELLKENLSQNEVVISQSSSINSNN